MTKTNSFILLSLSCAAFLHGYVATNACVKRSYGDQRFVCVCSESFCDFYKPLPTPKDGRYHKVTTSRDVPGYTSDPDIRIDDEKMNGYQPVEIDYNTEHNPILGFGGGFTDAAGINILSLSKPVQDFIIGSYFGMDGNQYNMGRLPIAGTDFSPRPYTYDDIQDDFQLKHFNLTSEDFDFKISMIRRAQEMAEEEILLVASSWSPPAWMKTNGRLQGSGKLLKENWQLFPKYIVKFLDAYLAEGISIWGITTQNEAEGGVQKEELGDLFLPGNDYVKWNQCAWTAPEMTEWIKCCFGPILRSSRHSSIKIIANDSPRHFFKYYTDEIFGDPEASQYIDGVSNHWYTDWDIDGSVMSNFQKVHPSQILMMTEACEGFNSVPEERVILGAWERGERYASNILDNLNHFGQAWLDWNLVLDTQGGPSYCGNTVDAPILVNKTSNEFYKQPMFYTLGHFSRFVKRGSIRLQSKIENSNIETGAFKDKTKGLLTITLLNKSENHEKVTIRTSDNKFINVNLPPKSLTTIVTGFNSSKGLKKEL